MKFVRLYKEAVKSYFDRGVRVMSDLEFDRVKERLEAYETKNIQDSKERVTSKLGSITENTGKLSNRETENTNALN